LDGKRCETPWILASQGVHSEGWEWEVVGPQEIEGRVYHESVQWTSFFLALLLTNCVHFFSKVVNQRCLDASLEFPRLYKVAPMKWMIHTEEIPDLTRQF